MNSSNLTRVTRLIGHLLTHPADIGPYLKTGPLIKKSPLDLGLPWFSQAAIRFLDGHVQPGMRVFEYGAGGSTLFFASRGAEVTSTENVAEWLDRIREVLPAELESKVTLQHRPFDFHDVKDFDNSEYLNSMPDEPFDIIVVDGEEHKTKTRPTCFQHAQSRVKSGGIIILDDSWRYQELVHESKAKKVIDFRGTGPCRPGVTSTAVFFY